MGGHLQNFEGKKISGVLAEDLYAIKKIFLRDSILRVREFHCGGTIGVDCAAVYFDGMVDSSRINDSIIRPIMQVGLGELKGEGRSVTDESERAVRSDPADVIMRRVLYSNELSKTDDWGAILRSIMYGDTLLLIDGSPFALIANTKGFSTRSISEPEDERILEGPREGFSEAAMINLSLLRRKLQTPDLCIEQLKVGRRTDTYVSAHGGQGDQKTDREHQHRRNSRLKLPLRADLGAKAFPLSLVGIDRASRHRRGKTP